MDNNIDTIIGLNVTLKGNLKNQGSIQVNGTVDGEMRSDEHITIGETAKVKGPITAKTVEVSGQVTGIIEATERLEIHPTGHVIGDIIAPTLIIQQGATFIGKSSMPSKNGVEAPVVTPTKEKEAPAEPAPVVEAEPAKAETPKEEEKAKKNEKDEETEKDPLGFFRK